jgi:hypothetical protein
MLTEDNKLYLAESMAAHLTDCTDFDEYVDFYCDMHDLETPPRSMDSMDFEEYFYDFHLGLYADEWEDEAVVKKAIEEGVIESLESFLTMYAE